MTLLIIFLYRLCSDNSEYLTLKWELLPIVIWYNTPTLLKTQENFVLGPIQSFSNECLALISTVVDHPVWLFYDYGHLRC